MSHETIDRRMELATIPKTTKERCGFSKDKTSTARLLLSNVKSQERELNLLTKTTRLLLSW